MPSVQDIADQVNQKLDQVVANTAATVAEASAIDSHLQAGIVVLGQGLFAIHEAQKQGNSIADHHSKQNDTIICTLDHIAELLCGMTRKMTTQITLQERMAGTLDRLEGILELVHSRETIEYDRAAALQEQIEQCCPPPEPEPEPCPEPCRKPKERYYDPKGQDWEPPRGGKQSDKQPG